MSISILVNDVRPAAPGTKMIERCNELQWTNAISYGGTKTNWFAMGSYDTHRQTTISDTSENKLQFQSSPTIEGSI